MPRELNQPMGGNEMPRFGGIATMMRLPQAATTDGLDVSFVGVPLDLGTSNRSAALRPAPDPHRIRAAAPYNMATRAAPFDSLQVADIGDVATNPYDLKDSVRASRRRTTRSSRTAAGRSRSAAITRSRGRSRARCIKVRQVAVVHVDAHADVNDTMFGEKIAHGTPFRRAVEDGCAMRQGHADRPARHRLPRGRFRLVPPAGLHRRAGRGMLEQVARAADGAGARTRRRHTGLPELRHRRPRSVVRAGTGTPEIGGLTVQQGLEIVRGMKGLNIVGADLVEVAPPYDPTGTTALTGANLAFEMLCVMPGVAYR